MLDNTDYANRNNFVPFQSLKWCSPGNFSQGDQEPALAEPALDAHWFQITVTCVKREYEGGDETKKPKRERVGGWIEILSTAPSTKILNHKTTPPPQNK